MLEEVQVKDLKEVLQAAGIRLWRIQNAVVKAINTGDLNQKHKNSPVLVSGAMTIEAFVVNTLNKRKKTLSSVDISMLSPNARKTYHSLIVNVKADI